MSMHNIVGRERSGAHIVVRQFRAAPRQTFGGQVLKAIGALTVLIVVMSAAWAVFS